MQNNKKKSIKGMVVIGCIAVVIFAVFMGAHIGWAYNNYPELRGTVFDLMSAGMDHMTSDPMNFLPLNSMSLIYMAIIAAIGCSIVGVMAFSTWKYHYDEDAGGTAKWNDDKKMFAAYYSAPIDKEHHNNYKTDGPDNAIMTQDIRLCLNDKLTQRNSNVLVIGGSGAGKTFFYALPNGLQMNGCYVFTDPKGELMEDLGAVLKKYGYDLKVFNLQNMNRSMCYNPFHYIRDIKGVNSMVRCIVENTAGESKGSEGPFWDNSMKVLMQACVHYLRETRAEKDQNFANVMKLLRLAEVDEKNSNAKSRFDKLFDELATINPDSQAVKAYKAFRVASGNTLKSILVTVTTRLEAFNIPDVIALTSKDTIRLEEIGKKKNALFIVLPDEDPTFNFLAATMYTQLFERLYYDAKNYYPYTKMWGNGQDYFLYAPNEDDLLDLVDASKKAEINYNEETERYEVSNKDFKEGETIESFATETAAKWWLDNVGNSDNKVLSGGRCIPYYVRMVLDEFYNIGAIPNFPNKMSTIRSYKISCSIIVQNLGQITDMFGKEKMETIVGQCDSTLYLGGNDRATLEHMVFILGKTQKTQRSVTLSGKTGGDSQGRQQTTQDLFPYDQAAQMDNKWCVYILRGEKPFFERKYVATEHPHFKECGKYDDKNKYVCEFIVDKSVDEKRDKEEIKNKDEQTAKDKRDNIIVMKFNVKTICGEIFGNDKPQPQESPASPPAKKEDDDKPKKNEKKQEKSRDKDKESTSRFKANRKKQEKEDDYEVDYGQKSKSKNTRYDEITDDFDVSADGEDYMVMDDTYEAPVKELNKKVEVLTVHEPVFDSAVKQQIDHELLTREEEMEDRVEGFTDHYSMMAGISIY